MAEPMHDVAHRSLWNGNVTTWCGLVYKPGQGDSFVFACSPKASPQPQPRRRR